MKYLKTFEGRNYNRTTNYKYLNEDDTIKVKEFTKKYIDSLNIFDKIGKLKFNDFEVNGFDYFLIFETFFSQSSYKSDNNIYRSIDIFCDKNNISSAGPALRNSIFNIIREIYKEYNKIGLKDKLDKRLIYLLEKNPTKYEEIFLSYEDELNNSVKKACEWMLNIEKFNL
jgi:ABC-type sulfate transport system substrate-binding protein